LAPLNRQRWQQQKKKLFGRKLEIGCTLASPDALRVVGVGQHEAGRVHVVEGHQGSGHALEVLQAAVGG
jgi:hypothetical protein